MIRFRLSKAKSPSKQANANSGSKSDDSGEVDLRHLWPTLDFSSSGHVTLREVLIGLAVVSPSLQIEQTR